MCPIVNPFEHWLNHTYRENQLLASEEPDTRDAAVVVGAKQDDAGKGVLPELVETLEHAWREEQH